MENRGEGLGEMILALGVDERSGGDSPEIQSAEIPWNSSKLLKDPQVQLGFERGEKGG